MPETPASRTTDELLRILDSRRVPRSQNAAFTIDDLSSMAMLDTLGETYEVVQARFTGALPAAHAIGVREATTILGALQEVLSEVGAALRDQSPKRGPLPADILAETELQLSPQVAPGSVIFAMSPARDEALFDASTLLGDALAEVFELFDQVELPASSGGTPDTVSDSLRRFGPRTARQLVRFAGALKEHSLNLDVGIARSGSRPKGSRITTSGAGFLESLAENATKRTNEVEIVGEVHNVGRDHRYKIDTADRGRITVRGIDALTDVLQAALRHSPVRLTVLETESINSATGAVSYTFEALRAEAIEAAE
ncbi:hypothetical protein [Microbacterium flavescens]|uniref:hypothetical protein n=1 Tax=Microbacterium flavescens TaxID=69366 RepID=UPI001BDEF3B4|nr:hypothetical protein [Microbacterium flavescens]BFF10437.1 hypothetical protein GCM10025699_17400 [Microbacterium flavescens]